MLKPVLIAAAVLAAATTSVTAQGEARRLGSGWGEYVPENSQPIIVVVGKSAAAPAAVGPVARELGVTVELETYLVPRRHKRHHRWHRHSK